MMVYLAGPIDLVKDDERTQWRWMAAEILLQNGVSSYNPVAAFSTDLNPHAARVLVDINTDALRRCDFVIFTMGPSIGTPMELYMCHQFGIPHVVVWADKKVPAYLSVFADTIVPTLDDALAMAIEHSNEKYGEVV